MKTAYAILLLLAPYLFLSMTCRKYERNSDNCHHDFQFNNQSDKNIYVVVSYDYPDTSMNFQNPRFFDTYTDHVMANKMEYRVVYSDRCIEHSIQNSPGGKISIFIFDAKVIDSTPWSQVRQNYQVLKRYDYSLDELRNTYFSIDYP